ncbi:MAG TPA: hypothetical protein DEP84_23375 [Chloroflexi bacterium]|nr:hypothetical protein [Chloroflexota bacterium]
MDDVVIRPLRYGDLVALDQIDPNFVSESYLDVETEREGGSITWRLVERPFKQPFQKEIGYRYDTAELARTRLRLKEGRSLQLIAERAGRLVAILEVEPEEWRNTAIIWTLFVDTAARGRGLGRLLFERAVTWARERGFRALVLETQTNNVPAVRFYQRLGCQTAGLDTYFYTNRDIANHEVALFLYYEL